MSRALLTVLLLAATASMWVAWARARQAASPPETKPEVDRTDRVAVARIERGKLIEDKYRAVAVVYPGEIYVRWLKREAELELWARNGGRRFRLVATYAILKSSGLPGPKRREGDMQVPEGFYEVDRFNPKSNFHLSLGLNYPNAADRIHADPQRPGGDIFIHGSNVTVGCAPLGDESIEEVYLAAHDARRAGQKRIAVHVFPARMKGPEWETFAAAETEKRPELADFWAQLKPAYESFESRRLVPEVKITRAGRYVMKAIED
jgi:murein L,D-transpeptidase YafK